MSSFSRITYMPIERLEALGEKRAGPMLCMLIKKAQI
jgi:hypothetical protein